MARKEDLERLAAALRQLKDEPIWSERHCIGRVIVRHAARECAADIPDSIPATVRRCGRIHMRGRDRGQRRYVSGPGRGLIPGGTVTPRSRLRISRLIIAREAELRR